MARPVARDARASRTRWLVLPRNASVNYVRNVAAHHARLFNRKLQNAPSRPKVGKVPLLDHLRAEDTAKSNFGVYNALAVIAYLLRSIGDDATWRRGLVELLESFPSAPGLTIAAVGAPQGWASQSLWSDSPDPISV